MFKSSNIIVPMRPTGQQSLTSLDAHQQLVETLLGNLQTAKTPRNWLKTGRVLANFRHTIYHRSQRGCIKTDHSALAVMGKLVPQDPNDEPASERSNELRRKKLNW